MIKDKRMMDSTKLIWHMPRVAECFDYGRLVAPIHIDAGIAKFCNIKCVFCYGLFQNVEKVFIKRDALLNMLKDANEIGVRSIAFIGDGEPTCNPYLYEALSYARDHTGLDMAISTNGYLVNDREKCFDILTSCRWMRFCLSAGSREGYKKIHGKDCFEKIVENVKRMVDVKKTNAFECDIGLQAVFVPTIMKEDMIKESRLAVELGVNYFVIKQCSLPDDGESGMAGFDLKDYDKKETVELLRGCEAMSTKRTKIIVKWQTIERKGERPYDGCLSVPLISEISGNGNWFPCGYFFGDKKEYAQYKFGNIEKQRLVDIFKSKHYRDVLERMRYNFNVHSQCRGACRLDATNKFCYDYINRPEGINFI